MKKGAKNPKKAPKVPESDPVDVVASVGWYMAVPTVSCSANVAVPAATVSVAAPAPATIALSIGVPERLDSQERKRIIAEVTRSAGAILAAFKDKRGRRKTRTADDEVDLRQRLLREIRDAQAERVKAGEPHGQDAVLPEIAKNWGMSEGTLDHILYPRSAPRPKRKTSRK